MPTITRRPETLAQAGRDFGARVSYRYCGTCCGRKSLNISMTPPRVAADHVGS
jgi:hypothetical protein